MPSVTSQKCFTSWSVRKFDKAGSLKYEIRSTKLKENRSADVQDVWNIGEF